MQPIDVGLSASSAQTASNSGSRTIGGNTYGSNPVGWIVAGVLVLVALIVFLKLRK